MRLRDGLCAVCGIAVCAYANAGEFHEVAHPRPVYRTAVVVSGAWQPPRDHTHEEHARWVLIVGQTAAAVGSGGATLTPNTGHYALTGYPAELKVGRV